MNKLLLTFPIQLLQTWQFNKYIISEFNIKCHIHNIILTIFKKNNLLIKFLNNKITKYKRILTASIKTINILNKANYKKRAQKGLGKSRVGSCKSSLHRGGGVIFGPLPRNIYLKINNKEWLDIYTSIFIIKRKNILWFYINKNLLRYNLINFFDNLLHHLGIYNKEKVLFFLISKNVDYNYKLLYKYIMIKNLNFSSMLLNNYLIYLL